MDWNSLLNTHRLGKKPAKQELGRSPFNSDHDKIIFSSAFRRLGKKTQVHPMATNDHIHNRLTHSLEVACVGRSLGIRVGHALMEKHRLPPGFLPTDIGDIVQSACLAHDIGNPPFGHTGEEAIRNWFAQDGQPYLTGLTAEEQADLLNFEGNAQGLRVLTTSEYHPYAGGMRLTYATLGAFIKYPWTAAPANHGLRPKPKYGVFQAELAIFEEIALAVGLPQLGEHWYSRHPLVYLMEAADDFCYGILDLEDGLAMEILSWEEIFAILQPVLESTKMPEVYSELEQAAPKRKPEIIRGQIISAYIDAAAQAFMQHEDELFQGIPADLIGLCPELIRHSVHSAKETAKHKIFAHPRKIEVEIGAYYVISTLLEVMCAAVEQWVSHPKDISFKSKRVIDLIGANSFDPRITATDSRHSPKYLALMRVLDFISGMTDHYATYMAKQFNGMGDSR